MYLIFIVCRNNLVAGFLLATFAEKIMAPVAVAASEAVASGSAVLEPEPGPEPEPEPELEPVPVPVPEPEPVRQQAVAVAVAAVAIVALEVVAPEVFVAAVSFVVLAGISAGFDAGKLHKK